MFDLCVILSISGTIFLLCSLVEGHRKKWDNRIDFAACQDNSQKFQNKKLSPKTHFVYSSVYATCIRSVVDVQHFVIVEFIQLVQAIEFVVVCLNSIRFTVCAQHVECNAMRKND